MARALSKLATESPGQLEPGSLVDGYRVERVLSVDAANRVLVEAQSPKGNRVAIRLLGVAAADAKQRQGVLSLVRLRASIEHPHLVGLLGAGEHEGRLYLVNDLATTRTLADRLSDGPLPPDDAIRVVAGVSGALAAASRKGLHHSELSPHAIFLADGRPTHALLTDFGIGRTRSRPPDLRLTVEGADYLPPEEIRGEALAPQSNSYSLACILFECLGGTPPYPYERPLLTLHAHLVEPPPRLSERNSELPPELDYVFARAMAKEPDRRFDSAELVQAAAQALGVEAKIPEGVEPRTEKAPTRAKSPARRPARAATPRRRRGSTRRPVVALAAAALVASAVSGFALGGPGSSGEATSAAPAQPRPDAALLAQARYVRGLSPVIDRLSERRADARRRLRRARRPESQAQAARALAGAYADARKALDGEPPESLEGARLDAQLRSAERAYRRLGAAALGDNRRAWRSASRKAIEHERRLERSLNTLTSA